MKNLELKIFVGCVSLVLLIGVVVFGAVYFGRGGKIEKAETITSQSSKLMKDNFVGDCVGEDTTYEQCSCSYDKLLAKYGVEGFVGAALDYDKTGELKPEYVVAVLSCFE